MLTKLALFWYLSVFGFVYLKIALKYNIMYTVRIRESRAIDWYPKIKIFQNSFGKCDYGNSLYINYMYNKINKKSLKKMKKYNAKINLILYGFYWKVFFDE